MDKEIEQLAKDFCKATPRINPESGVMFYERLIIALKKAAQVGRNDADDADNLIIGMRTPLSNNLSDTLNIASQFVLHSEERGDFKHFVPKELLVRVYK